MLARQLLFGLIVAIFVCHPQDTFGQFIRNVPKFGSVSKARSNAFEREVDLGGIGLTSGFSNSRAVTKSNGGVRNGGTTSVANSKALSRGVNLGGLDIGSTLTQTQNRRNGAVSRGLEHDVNVGNLGFGSSLSRDNLKKGFGLQRSSNGGLSLGLGLLNFDVTNNAQRNNEALTNAQANSRGKGARARAGGNAVTNQRNFGLFGVTDKFSTSNAAGRARFGQTSANTGGFAGGSNTYAGTGFNRHRSVRSTRIARNPLAPFSLRISVGSRTKRQAQFIPFAYPEVYNQRVRRQFYRPGYSQPVWGSRPFRSNANAQGVAENKSHGFQQQAGANTHSKNEVNEHDLMQDNGAKKKKPK